MARPIAGAPTANTCTPNIELSVLAEGKLKTFNVPPQAAEEVRRRVDLHRRFQEAVAHIAQLNLRRWLSAKEAKGKAQEKP